MKSEYAPRRQAELHSFKVFDRLSYLGKQRDVTLKGLDLKFGDGNWMIGWVAGIGLKWREENKLLEGRYVVFDFPRACRLYEDAYYEFLKNNPATRTSGFLSISFDAVIFMISTPF